MFTYSDARSPSVRDDVEEQKRQKQKAVEVYPSQKAAIEKGKADKAKRLKEASQDLT